MMALEAARPQPFGGQGARADVTRRVALHQREETGGVRFAAGAIRAVLHLELLGDYSELNAIAQQVVGDGG